MEPASEKPIQQYQVQSKNSLALPIAIVIAGLSIGGGLIYSANLNQRTNVAGNIQQAPQQAAPVGDLNSMKPITSADHIKGNPKAPVKIVEYSDTECPFCKRFHPTLQQAIDEYGKDGKVAWVYRHFPLDSIHSKARKEAEATECAAELGGNDKFWEYLDRLYEVTPSNNGLDPSELPKIAEYVGLNKAKFISCLNSGKYAQHIQDELDDAMSTGGQGTPWNIVVAQNGKKFPLNGAQPYAAVKQIIDLALQEK